jgi:hypothetical protein
MFDKAWELELAKYATVAFYKQMASITKCLFKVE